MHEHNQTPNNSLSNKDSIKDKYSLTQMKRVFLAFYKQPKTMLMVEVETGIRRPNICRYVAKWKKLDCIKIVSLSICPISKRGGVQKLTTNPKMFPKSSQLKMF